MQNKQDINKILNKRSFQETDLDALNSKIMNLAKKTPQQEFTSTKVSTNIKLQAFLVAACFVMGIFTGINTQVDAVSNDMVEYIYIEEGVI